MRHEPVNPPSACAPADVEARYQANLPRWRAENSEALCAWTTDGPVRGSCGHRHRSRATAEQCLARDRAGCASQGGYSDRRVVEA